MADPLLSLAPSDLRALAGAIRSGRLVPPYSADSLARLLSKSATLAVEPSLKVLAESISPVGAAHHLEVLAEALTARPEAGDLVDLVTTAPMNGSATRDTSVVVSELFRNANSSVLIAGYAVHQGKRVFEALAERMNEVPELSVRMYLDIQRRPGDTSCDAELVRRFSNQFRTTQWPGGKRIPDVFYYPASISSDRRLGAALHAKCVVVDGEHVYVSSANFTEAAQLRNIEVGVLVHSAEIASRLIRFFESLVEARQLLLAE